METEELNKLRKIMGTMPDEKPEFKTDFFKGVTGIEVKMVDWSHNPYRAMYTLATSCWGKKIDKWNDTLPEGRFNVVKAVLQKVALPLAYESVQFTFVCENIPRWSFDQIARARQGVVFSSRGTRDNCVVPGTLVKTCVGLKPIENVSLTDKVLTHKRNYKKVLNIFKRDYEGKTICISTVGYLDKIILTPEHPVYAISFSNIKDKNTHRNNFNIKNAKWILAKDLKQGDVIIENVEQFNTEEIKFNLLKYYEQIYVGNQFGTSKTLHHVDIGVKLNDIVFDKNWAKLVGWYLAEGCLDYRYDKDGINKTTTTGITYCVGKTDFDRGYVKELITAIKKINKNINVNVKIKKIQNVKLPSGKILKNPQPAYYVKLRHRQIAQFVKDNFSEYSHTKRLPEWIFKLDNSILQELCDSFCKGDGTFKDKVIAFSCVNKMLIKQFKRIYDKLNIKSNIFKAGPVGFCLSPYYGGGLYCRTFLNNNYHFRQIKTLKTENYKGLVYNLEVKDDNSYVLENMTVHNCHLDAGFFMHDDIWEDEEMKKEFIETALKCKETYKKIAERGKHNWQSARSILPISNTHAFSMSINFAALQSMISKRTKFCEADATVAFAWLLREELKKKFPLLALYCYPSCDFRGECEYAKTYFLSNCFGCLFKPCGRNKTKEGVPDYASINTCCSNKEKIMEELNIYVPTAEEIRKDLENLTYDKLSDKDKVLFEEN